jgi:hypothetical protein
MVVPDCCGRNQRASSPCRRTYRASACLRTLRPVLGSAEAHPSAPMGHRVSGARPARPRADRALQTHAPELHCEGKAKRNVRKAQQAARRKRTIAHLPQSTRRSLTEEARKGRARGGKAGHALEDRNRQQLSEVARELGIAGRSTMGKWDPIKAIRAAR